MNQNDFLKPGDTIKSDKQFMGSEEVEKIADRVKQNENIDFGPAQIKYYLVYPKISKQRAAKVKKADKETTHETGINYFVEISGELWDMLDEDTRYLLVFHQLMKIDPTYKAKKQEWVMKKRKEDVSSFYTILKKHGSTYHETVQATMSSLYDLDPKKENKVRL